MSRWLATPHRVRTGEMARVRRRRDRDAGRGPVTSVIGAGGFIGARLALSLSAADVPFHAFTREVPFHDGDRLSSRLLDSDVIFYLAGRITPAVAERDPGRVAADLADLRSLLNGLRRARRSPVVVLASSGGTVYDPAATPPYRESTPTRPASAYGAAKLDQERALLAGSGWLRPVVLRLANVYGPGQKTTAGYGVIGHWLEAVRRGEPVRVFGDPACRRDYVHVADVCAAMLAVRRRYAEFGHHGQPAILNIGSGVSTSLAELLRDFQSAIGHELDVRWERARTFDHRDVWLDVREAARCIGWQPGTTLADGLASVVPHRGATGTSAPERDRSGRGAL